MERFARSLSKAAFAAADLVLGEWPGPRILIYHQLTHHPIREMDVAPVMFSKHVQWLADRGRFVDLDGAVLQPEHREASRDHVLTFDDGYSGLYKHAYPILKHLGVPFTLYVTSRLVSGPVTETSEFLNWDQINEMQDSDLLTIGAHTHTHPDLRELTADQVEEEIGLSDELIEHHTGVRPRHFAYTKGYWAKAAEPIVKSRYQTAVLGAGLPIDRQTDLHRLGRIPVQRSDGHFFFKRKIESGMRVEEWVRARLKGYENPNANAVVGETT